MLRIKNEKQNLIYTLSFNSEEQDVIFKLNEEGKQNLVTLHLNKEEFNRRRWQQVQILFNLVKNDVTLKVNKEINLSGLKFCRAKLEAGDVFRT